MDAEYEQIIKDSEHRFDEGVRRLANRVSNVNGVVVFYKSMIEASLEAIKDSHEGIAACKKVAERFPKDKKIQQFTDYFIRLNRCDIDKLMQEIRNYGEIIRESERVFRGGSGCINSRDESENGQPAGSDNTGQVADTNPG